MNASFATLLVPLQSAPDLFTSPVGTLLIALVVIAVILFVGRYVMSVAWRLIRLAIVVVAIIWLATVVAPMVGF
jgi:hypothetical protein